jgi:signal transduction histidine kinase
MLESIHDLALELRPPILDDLGLVPALAQYTRGCPEHIGLEVDFEVVGEASRRLPREMETTLYRIVQESLTNVARHAQAKKASVLLRVSECSVAAIIEDNGVGFDLNNVRAGQARQNRLGLYGMQERVALVGGSITFETAPGQGTNIYAEVPFQAPGER